jgi:vancomycin resistance protein YoaR
MPLLPGKKMRLSSALSNKGPALSTLAMHAGIALAAAVLGLLMVTLVFTLGGRLVYANRALPGVTAAGMNLAGDTLPEIESTLYRSLTYPQTGMVLLRDGDRSWSARPSDLGVIVDVPSMARRALGVGREGGLLGRFRDQLDSWYRGYIIAPLVIFDRRQGAAYLADLALQIDLPTIEASIELDGVEVIAKPGQIGRHLDIFATLDKLQPSVERLHDADLELVIQETPPRVLDPSPYADLARRVLSQPLTLTAESAGPWVIEPPDLAQMLQFQLAEDNAGNSVYRLSLDPEKMEAFLSPLAPDLARKPENARFYFDDETRQLVLVQPAVIGRELDVEGSMEAVNLGLGAGKHEIPIAFHTTDPAVKDEATAEALGITELVSDQKTYFQGSSASRIQNIKTAAGAFHGLLIPPGGTLSMVEVLGDISLDKGYTEALIIFGNRTIKGVGGGVCQVSTALFRTVFFGGYPIVERYPHAYRVRFYEQGGFPPGLDATVFVPLVDFKFTNDTPHWLLMETYVYKTTLEWKFYSTSDGRTVEWKNEFSDEVDPPRPLYIEKPDMPEGKIEQVDWAVKGMDAVVYRTVSRSGVILYQDVIKTHYLPWRDIYEFGPGAELPEDVEVQEAE